MTSISFLENRQKSKMMQLVEGNCLRTKAGELLHITKIHCSGNNLEKLVSIMGYMDETLFERMYGRITHLMRIMVQILVVKALLHF
jgi:hypothetical protein